TTPEFRSKTPERPTMRRKNAEASHSGVLQAQSVPLCDASTSWNKVEVDQPHRHHPQIVNPQLEGLLHFRSDPPARLHTRAPAGHAQASHFEAQERRSVPLWGASSPKRPTM